jgi:hypothetical protein
MWLIARGEPLATCMLAILMANCMWLNVKFLVVLYYSFEPPRS